MKTLAIRSDFDFKCSGFRVLILGLGIKIWRGIFFGIFFWAFFFLVLAPGGFCGFCGFVASVVSTVLAPGGFCGSWWLLVASAASVASMASMAPGS